MAEKLELNNKELSLSKRIHKLYTDFEKEYFNEFFQKKLDTMHEFCNVGFDKINSEYDESIEKINSLEVESIKKRGYLESELKSLEEDILNLKQNFGDNKSKINFEFKKEEENLSIQYTKDINELTKSLSNREKEIEEAIINKRKTEIVKIEAFKNELDSEIQTIEEQIRLVSEVINQNRQNGMQKEINTKKESVGSLGDYAISNIKQLLAELDNDNSGFLEALNSKLENEYDKIYPSFEYFKENVIDDKIAKHKRYLEEKNSELENIEDALNKEEQNIKDYMLEKTTLIKKIKNNTKIIENTQDTINSKNSIENIDIDSALTKEDDFEDLDNCVVDIYNDYNNKVNHINDSLEKTNQFQNNLISISKPIDFIISNSLKENMKTEIKFIDELSNINTHVIKPNNNITYNILDISKELFLNLKSIYLDTNIDKNLNSFKNKIQDFSTLQDTHNQNTIELKDKYDIDDKQKNIDKYIKDSNQKISNLKSTIHDMEKAKNIIDNSDSMDKIDRNLIEHIGDMISDLYKNYDEEILTLEGKNKKNNADIQSTFETLEKNKKDNLNTCTTNYNLIISCNEKYDQVELKILNIGQCIEEIDKKIDANNKSKYVQLKNFLPHIKQKYSNIENNIIFKQDSTNKENLDYVLNNDVIYQLEDQELYEIAVKLNDGEYQLIEYDYFPNCQIFGLIMYVLASFIGMAILKFNFFIIIELIAFTSIVNGVVLLAYNYLNSNKKEADNIYAIFTGGLLLGALLYIFKGGLGLIKTYKVLNLYVILAILSIGMCYIYMNQKTRIQSKSKTLNDKYYAVASNLISDINN